MSPLKQLLLLSLVVSLSALAITSTEAAKKKTRKKRRFQNSPAACGLAYGLKQHKCDVIASKCGVVWVGTCGPNLNGRGGCQKVGDCPRMQCEATCLKANGDAFAGTGCTWSNEACYKECFTGVGDFGVITSGQSFELLQDRDVDNNIATTARGARPASSGDWYFRFVARGPDNEADAASIGLYQVNDVTANLSQTILAPTPGTIPAYAWVSDGNIFNSISITKEPYVGGTFDVGDIIGVHYNGTNIWFSKNGVNQGVAFPSVASGPIDNTFPYVGAVQAHHIGTQIDCIPQ